MEKKEIASTIKTLEEERKFIENSKLSIFESFVLGFICGNDHETDRIQKYIHLIKEITQVVEKEEDIEATPPLDEVKTQSDHDTESFSDHEDKKSNQKPKVSYLMALKHNSNHMNKSNQNEEDEEQEIQYEKKKPFKVEREDSDVDYARYAQQFENAEEDEKRTLDLIRQLQEEDEAQKKDRQDKRQEIEDIDCAICLCELYTESVLALETCDHVFHKECLLEYIKNKIDDRQAHIKCPDEKCQSEVLVDDFKQLLGKQIFESYIKNSLESYVDQHADEMSWCPTPDCKYVFAYDEKEDDGYFKCPTCKKQYCLKCRVAYHKDQTCKEYQVTNSRDENDVKFEKFIKGKKFKQCIKCKFWVEKNQGCDHMTCRCKYEFCYKCGGKYRECECVQKMKEQQERLQKRREERLKKKVAPRGGRKRATK